MKTKFAIAAILIAVLAGCATTVPGVVGDQTTRRYVLADNHTLVVDGDGRMRMFDVYGEPVLMKDGVPMKLKDDTVIVMKENVIWKALRTKGTLGPRG